jgi:hypothetical protein
MHLLLRAKPRAPLIGYTCTILERQRAEQKLQPQMEYCKATRVTKAGFETACVQPFCRKQGSKMVTKECEINANENERSLLLADMVYLLRILLELASSFRSRPSPLFLIVAFMYRTNHSCDKYEYSIPHDDVFGFTATYACCWRRWRRPLARGSVK